MVPLNMRLTKKQRLHSSTTAANVSPLLNGNPQKFSRDDLETLVTRYFWGDRGTATGTDSPARLNSMIVTVGTRENPSDFPTQAVIFTCDMQPFHDLPDGPSAFKKTTTQKIDYVTRLLNGN